MNPSVCQMCKSTENAVIFGICSKDGQMKKSWKAFAAIAKAVPAPEDPVKSSRPDLRMEQEDQPQ